MMNGWTDTDRYVSIFKIGDTAGKYPYQSAESNSPRK